MFEKIIIIGAGGIGSHLLPPLYRFLNTVESPPQVCIVDGDKYSDSNADRQEFPTSMTGMNKAEVQKMRAAVLFPSLPVYSYEEYIGANNVNQIIPDKSIVLLCVDNHICRSIVSKRCQELKDVRLISGANELTDGNVQLFVKVDNIQLTPSIEERHPEISSTNDGDRSTMSCEDIEAMPGGGQIITTNLVVSTIMMQLFWKIIDAPSHISIPAIEIYFDINSCKTRIVDNHSKYHFMQDKSNGQS